MTPAYKIIILALTLYNNFIIFKNQIILKTIHLLDIHLYVRSIIHLLYKENPMTFTEQQIQAVWEKGITVINYDPHTWRKDQCGAWIYRSNYGNHNSSFGWEIDHQILQDNGGDDNIDNLRPLQWENNTTRSSDPLRCVVTSMGTKNIPLEPSP